LHGRLVDRGRVWNDATPGQVDPQTGAVTVTFAVPPATPLDDKAVLYLFDQAEVAGGGSYLGQFKVVGIGDTGVALEPTTKLTQRALDRLAAAQGPWSLCEVLPADNHEIFAGLAEADIEGLVPESTREEYLRDGQPAEPDDPPERVVEVEINGERVRLYQRPLRDYDVIFREDARLRTIEIDKINAAKKDLEYMTAAHAEAIKQEQHVRDLITSLETDLAKLTHERDAIVAHEQEVATQLASVQQNIDRLFAENKRLATELAELQADPTPPPGEAVSRP